MIIDLFAAMARQEKIILPNYFLDAFPEKRATPQPFQLAGLNRHVAALSASSAHQFKLATSRGDGRTCRAGSLEELSGQRPKAKAGPACIPPAPLLLENLDQVGLRGTLTFSALLQNKSPGRWLTASLCECSLQRVGGGNCQAPGRQRAGMQLQTTQPWKG